MTKRHRRDRPTNAPSRFRPAFETFRVERAQAHRAGKALDGIVVLATPDSKEAAEEPGCRQIRIERQRPLDQCYAAIEVPGQVRERMAASDEGDRIVLAQLHGALRQPSTLGHLLLPIIHPAMDLAPEVAPCRHRVSRCEIRIELHRLVEQAQRLGDGFSGALDGCLRTIPPREHGGNLDVKQIRTGVTVLLPCYVDGCGLAIGDMHYAQGDGEVAGTAIEIR